EEKSVAICNKQSAEQALACGVCLDGSVKSNKSWRDAMPRRTTAAAFTVAACFMAGAASAEPVKIALIETLSGSQAVTGKLFQSSVKYGLARLEAEKAWPDGIKLLEYDNQGGPSEAADKLKAAINDGATIIIQGASSANGGQITADVQKHNARNPG